MTHSRGYTISYLSQQPEFDEQLTVLEQVFHGDTPLIRLLREYEKALLHIEKIQVMKSTGTIICSAATYGCNECMGSKCKCEISLTKLGITDFTATVGNLSGGQKNVLRWRNVLLKHRIY